MRARRYTIACLAGDGIGPELMAEASRALDVRPSDPARGRTLTALYRRKVDVLWRVSRLAERRASGGTHDA